MTKRRSKTNTVYFEDIPQERKDYQTYKQRLEKLKKKKQLLILAVEGRIQHYNLWKDFKEEEIKLRQELMDMI